jgi:hypothetical protein
MTAKPLPWFVRLVCGVALRLALLAWLLMALVAGRREK